MLYSNDGASTNNTVIQFIKDTIGYINNNGLTFLSSTGPDVDSCYIHDIGMIPGMGIATSGYEGISMSSVGGSRIIATSILHIGYDGIAIKGANDTVNDNIIDSFCLNLIDGAGIYWYENSGATDSNKICLNNIVRNGGGPNSRLGTVGGIAGETGAVGIYNDQNSTHIKEWYNTCYNNSQAGFYLHAAAHISAQHNTSYNNGWVQFQMNRDNSSYPLMRFDTIEYNNFGAPGTPSTYLGTMWCLTTLDGNYDSVGIINNNNYLSTNPIFYVGTSTGSTTLNSYSQWGTSTGTDINSGLFNYPIQDFRVNTSLTTSQTITPPVWSNYWLDLTNTQQFSYTLPAMSSIIWLPYRYIYSFGVF